MSLELFDLSSGPKKDLRFSPFCLRVKYILNFHKVAHVTIPVRFTEKEKIAFSKQPLVPVLRFPNGDFVTDSWKIAEKLCSMIGKDSVVFYGDASKTSVRLFCKLIDTVLVSDLFHLVVYQIFLSLEDATDKEYFRTTREKGLRQKLEDIDAQHATYRSKLTTTFRIFEAFLQSQKEHNQHYFFGPKPSYADFSLLSIIEWGSAFPGRFVFTDICNPKSFPLLNQWRDSLLPQVNASSTSAKL